MDRYLDFLVRDFTVSGVTLQYWMPIAVVLFVISMTVLEEEL